MIIEGQHRQSIWYEADRDVVGIIDQTLLPHRFEMRQLSTLDEVCEAITSMQLRGAPLIGVAAAYGMYLALRVAPEQLQEAAARLAATRPTAVNLQWALQRVTAALQDLPAAARVERALELARRMEQEDVAICEAIGAHGARLLEDKWQQIRSRRDTLNVLTHCNAGALATVDWGTALSVIYKASAAGVPVHVWVDETRPRNQGAALTCWELGQQGIEHTLIVDNAGGHLMQHGMVDACVVGSDRTTLNGDVCNKIGTYLKALAARDNGVPFYVALPLSSIDFELEDGLGDIPIEERDGSEVTHIAGRDAAGDTRSVNIAPAGVRVSNYGFDVTPAKLVTAIITERGVCPATRDALTALRDQPG